MSLTTRAVRATTGLASLFDISGWDSTAGLPRFFGGVRSSLMADATMTADSVTAATNETACQGRILFKRSYKYLVFIAHTPLVRKKENTTLN
jgi:hypothetical protein